MKLHSIDLYRCIKIGKLHQTSIIQTITIMIAYLSNNANQFLECLRYNIHIPVTAYNWWCDHDILIFEKPNPIMTGADVVWYDLPCTLDNIQSCINHHNGRNKENGENVGSVTIWTCTSITSIMIGTQDQSSCSLEWLLFFITGTAKNNWVSDLTPEYQQNKMGSHSSVSR